MPASRLLVHREDEGHLRALRLVRLPEGGTCAVSTGACDRCHRDDLPLAGGQCRGCRWHVANYGSGDIARFGTQLWLGSPVPAPTSLRHSDVAMSTPRRPVSEHIA